MNPAQLAENPFYVLEIPTTASRLEVERAGQKLLALLTIKSESAQTYRTPFGPRRRDEALVRAALAALRDPGVRLRHELWFDATLHHEPAPHDAAWDAAFRSIDWGAPCTVD